MPFNKIQPEQIQLATFFSSSGDIAISQTDTGVGLNLSRNLVGDFTITGDSPDPLVINKRAVFTMPLTGTNTVENPRSGTFVFNGADNVVSGTRNIVINGDNDSFSGNSVDNVSVNGSNQIFGSGVDGCTALAGNGASFSSTTGAVIISDGLAAATTAFSNHSLNIDFASGTFIEGGTTNFLSSYHVNSVSSGLHSGSLKVLGNTFLGTNAKMPLFSGQSVIAESGVFMFSGGRPIYHDGVNWVGITTEPI
tara:strand:+ start:5760 stop:6512 length:753 start_codon:yes stop_codon:yes gene_type:complete